MWSFSALQLNALSATLVLLSTSLINTSVTALPTGLSHLSVQSYRGPNVIYSSDDEGEEDESTEGTAFTVSMTPASVDEAAAYAEVESFLGMFAFMEAVEKAMQWASITSALNSFVGSLEQAAPEPIPKHQDIILSSEQYPSSSSFMDTSSGDSDITYVVDPSVMARQQSQFNMTGETLVIGL